MAGNDLSASVGGSVYNGGVAEANQRLSLLAQDSIRNALAGDIRAGQVDLVTLKGDIVNDRTAIAVRDGAGMRTVTDEGARITAGDNFTAESGQDFTNHGSVKAGGNVDITAARDINIVAKQDVSEKHEFHNGGHNSSVTTDVKNLAATVTAGGDVNFRAGQDGNFIASDVKAGNDINVAVERDFNVASAGDVHNVESRSKDGKKRIKEENDTTTQRASTFTAGNNFTSEAQRDTTLVASKITAGNEAYLYSGEQTNLLAAQDSTHTLYDMKENGGWGAKKMQRDDVTQQTNVGTEIKTGGDLTIESGGDQRYQVAKLESGKDITLVSGGAVAFEGVKDLHDESHTKSKSDLSWFSAKGKGNTDETLRQSELVAQGQLAIKAVDGLRIDIKQINQNTVTQTIDAMVKADPQLAWLKEAEQRGDVNWQQVKELHDSFKYSNSGMGQGAMLAVIIVVTALTAGAASALAASAGSTVGAGATMAAGYTTAAGVVVPAGLGNIMTSAVLTSLASTGAVSLINNKGNVGTALKDTFSSASLKGAAISGLAAGALNYADANWFNGSTQSGTAAGTNSVQGVAPSANSTLAVTNSPSDILRWGAVSDTATRAVGRAAISSGISTAIEGGSFGKNFGTALVSEASNVAMATGFNFVGDYVKFPDGSVEKIMAHAVMGGLLAEATGSDFKTGAVTAGLNEALIKQMADIAGDNPQIHLMLSQLTGLFAAAAVDGDLAKGAEVAQKATTFNWFEHKEGRQADEARQGCVEKGGDIAACQNNITRAMAALDAERQRDLYTYAREVQAQAYKEGWTLDQYNEKLAAYWTGIDTSQITTGYAPASEFKYVSGEVWTGVKDAVITYPSRTLDGLSNTWYTLTSGHVLASIGDAAVGVADWLGSPIPSHTFEEAFDKFATASPQQAGGVAFDLVAGTATGVIGGKAVQWIGGKWVDAAGAPAKNLNVNSALTDAEAGALVQRNVLEAGAKGGEALSNDVLVEARIGNGTKGQGSGNKVDQLPNKQVVGADGKPIPVYSEPERLNGPYATQEFPSTPVAHGFPDIVDNYANSATKFPLNNGSSLYQASGSYNGVSGRFEWIVDPKLGGVTHRMFVPNGTVNGIPVKP